MDSKEMFEKLCQCDEKTPRWSLCGLETLAKCVNVYDGDTCQLVFYVEGIDKFCRFTCRCNDYDSPEIKSENENEKVKAYEARDYLSSLILNKIVTIKIGKFDKYKRPLVDIYVDDIFINYHMIEKGYGYPYKGGKKRKINTKSANKIV